MYTSLQSTVSIASSSSGRSNILYDPTAPCGRAIILPPNPARLQQLHHRDYNPNRYNLRGGFRTLEDGNGDGMKSTLPCSNHAASCTSHSAIPAYRASKSNLIPSTYTLISCHSAPAGPEKVLRIALCNQMNLLRASKSLPTNPLTI